MSANVDVLAVMDRTLVLGLPLSRVDDMATARAAVAELIEAAAGIEGLARLAAAPLRDYRSAVDRLTAALAGVGGAT